VVDDISRYNSYFKIINESNRLFERAQWIKTTLSLPAAAEDITTARTPEVI
jgi:hypothetical protein